MTDNGIAYANYHHIKPDLKCYRYIFSYVNTYVFFDIHCGWYDSIFSVFVLCLPIITTDEIVVSSWPVFTPYYQPW